MPIYWGDLHSHCAVSYGAGTPARALDTARQHLDFCSITGHAFWPDMPTDLERNSNTIGIHLGGFAKLQNNWPDLLRQLEAACGDGFVALPSYEWHSCEFGDYNCYVNRYDAALIDGPDRKGLEANLRAAGREFFLMPHHCAYSVGHRGLNWAGFDEAVSPLIEIYSNHGCGKADDAWYDYHHSMGPRADESMVRRGLVEGRRFGFAAGTDTHDGYPGHYGHGRTGVLAERLDLDTLWAALRERRTIASTGARIQVQATLGDAGIGQVGPRRDGLRLRADIEATSSIERVDVVEGGNGTHRVRRLPGNDVTFAYAPGRYKVRIECGWGRFGSAPVDWEVSAEVVDGSLRGVEPCFRHSAYDNSEITTSERILERGERELRWACRSVPNPAGLLAGTHFNASGPQGMVLDIDAGQTARLRVRTHGTDLKLPLADLVGGSVAQQIDGFGSAAVRVGRAIPEAELRYQLDEAYEPLGDGPGWAYLRIVQSDGQMAWVSPIWYE